MNSHQVQNYQRGLLESSRMIQNRDLELRVKTAELFQVIVEKGENKNF